MRIATSGVRSRTPSVSTHCVRRFVPTVWAYPFRSAARRLIYSFLTAVAFLGLAPMAAAQSNIWSSSVTPAIIDSGDGNSVELGVKFKSDVAGFITGVRFFKSAANTGTHRANLWTSTGTLLATALFTGETASGWQQATFASPVAISANTTYVASYFAPVGRYSFNDGYFNAAGVDNGVLHALSAGSSGGNGVYLYGSTGGFPASTYNGTNYWVDVVFSAGGGTADTTPPTVTAVSPTSNATGVAANTPVAVTFSEPMNATTISTSTIELRNAANALVSATVAYNSTTRVATLTPGSPLAASTTYTIRVLGGTLDPRVKDVAGNALAATYTSSFTTAAAAPADTTPPTVSSVSPTSGATGVSATAAVAITFSEPMNATTISTSTIELRNAANTVVSAAVAYNATTRVATLTPASALAASATYTVRVLGGTTDPRVKDVAGNALAATYTSSFTTAASGTSAGTTATSIWSSNPVPGVVDSGDGNAIEIGLKFRSDVSGYVTGVRFYKSAANTGTHRGSLWSASGAVLANATFTGETASGWQQVTFATPVWITANTTYIASYYAPVGGYSTDIGYFNSNGFDNGVLHALSNTAAGGNGVYRYGGGFPDQNYASTNFWVDVLFSYGNVGVAPATVSPTPGSTAVNVGSNITVKFATAMNASTLTSSTIELRDALTNALIPAAIRYDSTTFTVTLDPTANLPYSTNYKVIVKGGPNGVKDLAGNTLSADYTWTFRTAALPMDQGPGGPILVVTAASNPFTKYYAEILRAEGFNAFAVADIGSVSSTLLNAYDVVILGEMALTSTQVSMFTTWVNSGRKLIAMKPDKKLAGLLGLSDLASTRSNAYMTVNTGAAPGAGITSYGMQFHGTAARYALAGASAVATLQTALTAASLWDAAVIPQNATSDDGSAIEVGIKFQSDVAGVITGIRFYKDSNNTGTHRGSLWTSTGKLLGSATFTNETATGWQQVNFATPIAIAANTTYVASYFAPRGGYTVTNNYFAGTGIDNRSLHALSDTAAGGNGVYLLSSTGGFPSQTGIGANYWVDVVFLPTGDPAVTLRNVGSAGGQAAAFTYDLARSIVYTRQGNPAWVGQDRDRIETVGTNDLFYGASITNPQPDWVDLANLQVPQADEQQRLLANLIIHMNRNRKPLPRFWYLPDGLKAAVLLTGDDHAIGPNTPARWDYYLSQSPAGCSVDNWTCIRATSYVFPNAPISDAQVVYYQNLGFDLALHLNTNCDVYTPSTIASFFTNQLSAFRNNYPSAGPILSNRTHCTAWSDWSSQAKVELANGIRLDTNYYPIPGRWFGNRVGFMTGSATPMRFADLDGTMIDVFQAATQMADDADQVYPFTVDELLIRALGTEGYYGVFTANMHNDSPRLPQADAVIASALARGVPVVSAKQVLTWVDGRNAASFTGLAWSSSTLNFGIAGAVRGLVAMLPMSGPSGTLSRITRQGTAISYSVTTIKGVAYATFAAVNGTYAASYTNP